MNKSVLLKLVLFFISTLLAFNCKKKSNSLVVDYSKKIDSITEKYIEEGKLNGNVLVVKDDKVIYEKSFGFSEGSQFKRLAINDKFSLGSIYKEFPAVAIMQLVEQGKLDINDKVSKFFPNYNDWATKISINHLFNYTSGLPKFQWRKYQNMSDADVMNDLNQLEELNFIPGTDYEYTNNNPFLLQKIVEKVSGKNFYEYAKENLFKPSNMNETVLEKQIPLVNKNNFAVAFNKDFKEDAYPLRVSLLYFSTVKDLAKWFKSLHSYQLITKKSLLTLSNVAHIKRNNKQSPLGNVTLKNNNVLEHIHHGSSGNYEAIVSYIKKKKLTIIILTNLKANIVSDLSEEIDNLFK